MCPICDGKSVEEVLHDLHHVVELLGWAVQAVEASRPWVYTIGLADRYGHPELVLAGVDISLSMHLLNALGTMVATGEELRPGGKEVVVGEREVTFGAVHPVHLATGLVGTWESYYEWRPGPSPALEVVQVLPLPGRRFPLDQPHTTLAI
jgi:hypothetical protein